MKKPYTRIPLIVILDCFDTGLRQSLKEDGDLTVIKITYGNTLNVTKEPPYQGLLDMLQAVASRHGYTMIDAVAEVEDGESVVTYVAARKKWFNEILLEGAV